MLVDTTITPKRFLTENGLSETIPNFRLDKTPKIWENILMNYSTDEHEYTELKAQFHQERMLEPTEPHDGGYLLVDDNQVEEPVAFRSVDGAVDWSGCYENYTVYQLKKVL